MNGRLKNCVILSSSGDPGHLLIQKGAERAFRESIPTSDSWSVDVVDKHLAWTVAGANDLLGRLLRADALLVAVGPGLWPGSHLADWAGPVLTAVDRLRDMNIPMAALALGSCLANSSDSGLYAGSEETAYLSELLSYMTLVTSRDRTMHDVLNGLGLKNELLPCISSLALSELAPPPQGGKVVLNYMHGAGHHDYKMEHDPRDWFAEFRQLVAYANDSGRAVTLMAHSPSEMELAYQVAPDAQLVRVRDVSDFLAASEGASFGVVNRIHGAIGLASLGVPSLCVGSDTRLESVSEFGLPTLNVGSLRLSSETWANRLAVLDARTEWWSALREHVRRGWRTHVSLLAEWHEGGERR